MPRISIANAQTFKADVDFPRAGGEPIRVVFEFRYLDRIQLAELFDPWNAQRESLFEELQCDEPSLVKSAQAETRLEASQLWEIVVGWEFEDEFCEAALLELVKTSVAAPHAVLDAYQQAYQPARLGN